MSDSTQATPANAPGQTTVASTIPAALNRLLLMTVKTFYTREQFIIIYYVMNEVCISEEKLRIKLCFDSKLLRQLSVQLKQDKLLRERLVNEKTGPGRGTTIFYYFINYRAIVNIVKYKVEHMRLRIEARAKSLVHKAAYKCTSCHAEYDTMEVDRIVDMNTGNLVCYRCQGEVSTQEISQMDTSSGTMSLFNEQMRPIFECLQSMEGIQLAPHLCEPDIDKFVEKDRAEKSAQLAKELGESIDNPSSAAPAMMPRMSVAHAIGITYKNSDTITVQMNAEQAAPVATREIPTWLRNDEAEETHAIPITSLQPLPSIISEPRPTLDINDLVAIEHHEEDLPRASGDKPADGTSEDEQSEDDDEVEVFVHVQGNKVLLSEVTPEMVERMTESEKQHYVTKVNEISSHF